MHIVRNKLILLLAVGVIAVAAFGVVGSAAWFTDDAVVPISATGATLDIRAEVARVPETGPILSTDVVYYDPSGVTIEIDDLAPGALSEKYMISVQNQNPAVSSLDAVYWYTASKTSSTPGFWNALNVQVEYGSCVDYDLGFVKGLIYDGALKDLYFDVVDNDYYLGDVISPNNTHCYRFAFYLDETAGNDLQGGSAEFDIVINATQPENTGWPGYTP